MAYKIHPGIGVARVGDSPTDWFVGPETYAEPEPPYGGYRDGDGRIKRQAGRFRVFDHVGGTATPVNGALVTWTVLLGPSSTGPTLTLTGPNQVARHPGSPSLGEIRTDSEGNLLVLGGVVAGATFAATGCGRISATVSGTPALRSWVLLLPPNFTPCRRPSLSVYDYIIQRLGVGVPSPLSFMRDVYPILKAIEIPDTNLPFGSAAEHTAASGFVTFPAASFSGACASHVTATEAAILSAWVAGTFVNDWSSPPPRPSPGDPNELDRGPLSYVCFGGWDLGSGPQNPLIDSLHFLAGDPLRLDLSPPNDYPAAFDGFPNWRTDNCTGEWPQIWGTAGRVHTSLPNPWYSRGFVVRQAGDQAYVENVLSDPSSVLIPFVMLQTRTLEFGSVRQSTTRTETASILLEVGHQSAGVSFTLVLPSWLTGPASYSVPAQATGVITIERIPITYAPGTTNIDRSGVIEVQQSGGPTYRIPVHAATVDATASEVAFALDFSVSMLGLCADGLRKLDKLRQALASFIALMQPDDRVGASAFDHRSLGTLELSPPDTSLATFADGFSPVGSTSVGRGIIDAVGVLSRGTSTRQALIVVTDGIENGAPSINTAMGSIADPTRVFAVGIGRTGDVNTSALQALCGNQGGYLLLTGSLAAATEGLVLDKYFLRILANATNLDTILDPPFVLQPGKVERIAFDITEYDHTFDAIVLAAARESIAFLLEAPDGTTVTPETLEGFPGNHYVSRGNVVYYRVKLPLPLRSGPAVATGTWHLVLAVRKPVSQRTSAELRDLVENQYAAQRSFRGNARDDTQTSVRLPPRVVGPAAGPPVPCETIIHTQSDLHLEATLQQQSIARGAPVFLEAVLTLKGVPFAGKVRATALIQDPTGFSFTQSLRAEGAGRYVGRFEPIRPGIYRITTVCEGITPKGHAFRREQLATAAVFDDRNGSLPAREAGKGGETSDPPVAGGAPCEHDHPVARPRCGGCACCLLLGLLRAGCRRVRLAPCPRGAR